MYEYIAFWFFIITLLCSFYESKLFSNAIVNNRTEFHCNIFSLEVATNSSFVLILQGITAWYNYYIYDAIKDSFMLDQNITTASSYDSKMSVYNTGGIYVIVIP